MRADDRSQVVGRVADALVWVLKQRNLFTKYELAEAIGVGVRTAHRYLLVFETRDLIDCRRHESPWPWEWRLIEK